MRKLHLEVITPAGVIASVQADMVVLPGIDGKFGVLPGHIRFLSGIVPGELHYINDNKTEYMAVSSGFAEVNNDRVSILADSAEMAGNIDVKRAMSAMERAKQRLARKIDTGETDLARAEASLKRADSRLKVSEKSS
jgi:F-type H+-transporting ATPase subunit epsilon